MSLIVDEHREFLSDQVRVSAFQRALAQVIRPGAIVVDLGCGTGILALLACRLGAGRVYAIEREGLIELARQVAAANGFADRIVFIRGMSSEIVLPEPADVIVSDLIGRFGIEGGLIEYVSDARERWLKPDGVIIPSRVELQLAAIEAFELHKHVEFWNGRPAGFEFAAARRMAVNTGYPAMLVSDMLLGLPSTGACLDLSHVKNSPLTASGAIRVTRRGTLHGIGGWFSAQLSLDVTLSNSPLATPRLARRNVFFPIDVPVIVEPDDEVEVRMDIVAPETCVTWNVDVWAKRQQDGSRQRKAGCRHSTLKGMLLSREDLTQSDPRLAPSLTTRGRARLSVLELCDGRRVLADIEREVYERHAELFPSLANASAFVAEVVSRYAQS